MVVDIEPVVVNFFSDVLTNFTSLPDIHVNIQFIQNMASGFLRGTQVTMVKAVNMVAASTTNVLGEGKANDLCGLV